MCPCLATALFQGQAAEVTMHVFQDVAVWCDVELHGLVLARMTTLVCWGRGIGRLNL